MTSIFVVVVAIVTYMWAFDGTENVKRWSAGGVSFAIAQGRCLEPIKSYTCPKPSKGKKRGTDRTANRPKPQLCSIRGVRKATRGSAQGLSKRLSTIGDECWILLERSGISAPGR